jgi:hypothetical protein
MASPNVVKVAQTFTLERFAWDAPDRLAVSGWFSGTAPADAPVLVVHGAERKHRLPAVPDSFPSSLEDGRPWRAAFAWQGTPAAFDVAELELGADSVVELPRPGSSHGLGDEVLEVRRPHAEPEDAVLRDELARAREDLESERERRAADAERFREGLALVRATAEEAVAVAQSNAQRLRAALREAHDEVDTLRERVAILEQVDTEVGQLRSELETARRRADDAHVKLRDAHRRVVQTKAEAERLIERLTAVEHALDDGA